MLFQRLPGGEAARESRLYTEWVECFQDSLTSSRAPAQNRTYSSALVANFVAVVDPDAERRRRFIERLGPDLVLVAGIPLVVARPSGLKTPDVRALESSS